VILKRLAGRALDRGALDRPAVEAWWKKASAIGEERYLVAHVLEDKEWPNALMLGIIAKKYPQRLGELYRQLLDKEPEMVSWYFAATISTSSLSVNTKRELMVYGLKSKNLRHRIDALRELAKFDQELFELRLISELKSLPKGSQVPYWRCPQVAISSVVCTTRNPAVWKAFEEAAKRADVGLRMELLGMYFFETPKTENEDVPLTPQASFKEQLVFLSHFLADETLRDVSKSPALYTGPSAADGSDGKPAFARIQVRNYAAMCIAYGLGIDRNPSPAWSETKWARFREEMRLDMNDRGGKAARADVRRKIARLDMAGGPERAQEMICNLAFRSSPGTCGRRNRAAHPSATRNG
jgi:hypothetical protein